MKFNAACIQINSQNNLQENIDKAVSLIEEAAKQGADFITLPENVAFMGKDGDDLMANTYLPEEHPALSAFCKTAKSVKKHILIGSIAVKIPDSEKIANRCYLINDQGKVAAQYDKIHLYDVSVKGGETHQESKRYEAGTEAVIADTPWGKLGMTICYDVRFPHLYRSLAKSGAGIITVPAAFTKFTGEAHWHVLLRARAIENGCYIIAPAQTGKHPSGRATYGHSLIIDPWGNVISDGGDKEGVTIAEIDLGMVNTIREQLPSLQHDRPF